VEAIWSAICFRTRGMLGEAGGGGVLPVAATPLRSETSLDYDRSKVSNWSIPAEAMG